MNEIEKPESRIDPLKILYNDTPKPREDEYGVTQQINKRFIFWVVIGTCFLISGLTLTIFAALSTIKHQSIRSKNMLILARKPQERIFIELGNNQRIEIVYTRHSGDKVWIGINAPKKMAIYREEVFDRMFGNSKKEAKK